MHDLKEKIYEIYVFIIKISYSTISTWPLYSHSSSPWILIPWTKSIHPSLRRLWSNIFPRVRKFEKKKGKKERVVTSELYASTSPFLVPWQMQEIRYDRTVTSHWVFPTLKRARGEAGNIIHWSKAHVGMSSFSFFCDCEVGIYYAMISDPVILPSSSFLWHGSQKQLQGTVPQFPELGHGTCLSPPPSGSPSYPLGDDRGIRKMHGAWWKDCRPIWKVHCPLENKINKRKS